MPIAEDLCKNGPTKIGFAGGIAIAAKAQTQLLHRANACRYISAASTYQHQYCLQE